MNSVNIIGSGIIGMLSAHELIKKGFNVNLFDRGIAGGESTWAGGGIISPLFPWRYDDAITQLSLLSQHLYPSTLEELGTYSDIDPEYLNSGLLMLDCDDLTQAKAWFKKHKIEYQYLNQQHIIKHFEVLSSSFKQAIWMPQIHQIRNPRFAKLVKSSLLKQGAIFHENTPISDIKMNHQEIEFIYSHQQKFKADITLVCTGAWSGEFIQPMDDDKNLNIHPVHGQMLLLNCGKNYFKEIILSDGRYIIPRKDGRVLVGSTTEMIGFKKHTTEQIRKELYQYACKNIPSLKHATIEKHWSGLRPGSIKGIPTISQHPTLKNVYINAGHYRNGLVTAPASAKLIQQLICQENPSIEPSAYTF